ncbi:hypothetical protein [Dokdonia donghaensis]|uniref:Uncharacterized protein n=1 Tax=Dokdonia donghaensis DSW-1 TaxID=1300343 RepID=A0A0A2GT25_9FLAO|nr:hypothetical protein [Dokdonia donghaensis]ANH61360.1 hypothetical protein I597_2463 [Dokdonia donghaensis DSW-1]KGO05451.1 hypothetical protein NV36_00385 [Dokdonia donghaensis DSW-1]
MSKEVLTFTTEKMHKYKSWKELINRVLIDSGDFLNPKNVIKGETRIEIFKSTKQNSLTEIRAAYMENDFLIYLHIFNPRVPGYNKYVENEYFYYYDFDDKNSYGDPGLKFNKQNTDGVLSLLKTGLKGKEVQYLKDNKVLKSRLYIKGVNSKFNFSYTYDFSKKRGFWNRILGQRIEKMSGIEEREIDLVTIFSGIEISS